MKRLKNIFLCCMLAITAGNGYAQLLKKPVPDKLVVLTFDDAPVTHYTFVAPLLKKYGFGATFFVCEFPPNYADTTKYMTWRQIKQLSKWGFEIGNHTRTHAHVDRLTPEQFADQLHYIEHKCDSLKIGVPTSFAYPGYGLKESALETLKEKKYGFARAGGSRAYDPLMDHPYLIPSWAPDSTNQQKIMDALQEAKNGKIVVLTFHGVPDYEHPWVTTPPDEFKQYLQFLHDHHYKVIALKDLKKYINVQKAQKLIQPNFQQPLKN